MQTILAHENPSYVNRAAFLAATTLSAASIGFTFAALAASSTVTAVALGALSVVALSASMGSITAWTQHPKNISEYGKKTTEHTVIFLVGMMQYTGQVVYRIGVEMLCQRIANAFKHK